MRADTLSQGGGGVGATEGPGGLAQLVHRQSPNMLHMCVLLVLQMVLSYSLPGFLLAQLPAMWDPAAVL